MRRELRAQQTEAFDAAAAALTKYERVRVVMACASGKTLVGMRLAENFNKILMLEPSLALIRQALEEARLDGLLQGRTVICVCSDKSIASEDIWRVEADELGVPVTTDPATLRTLLQNSNDRCVVFCTYQSQALLRDSLPAGFQFDFGNFDEAHRTAGARDRTFSIALSDSQIPIRKRLFLTATPRLFTTDIPEKTEPAFSMDDEATYGVLAYELLLGAAIERGIVCDYEVLTACVSGVEVQEAVKKAANLLLPQKQLPVDLVAGQIAVARAIEATGSRRTITFHATIDEAAAFTRDRLSIFRQAGITPFHIHGDMPGRQRKAVFEAFLSFEGPTLLTNCHCLTEGVDVPEIDMVGVMCRKESVQELVQALGRALRNRPGKDRGYVMLPLYVDENEPVETAVMRSDMGVTWEILHTILESDGALTDTMTHLRPPARDDAPGTEHHRRGHLRVVAPAALLKDLQRAISVRHIHRLSARWDVMLAAAKRYVGREGVLLVPPDHLEDHLPLGRWIETQRRLYRRGRLPTTRVTQLTEMGMLWRTRDAKWDIGLKLARDFHKTHGHMTVSSDEPVLLAWLKNARQQLYKGTCSPERQADLLDLGIAIQRSATWQSNLLDSGIRKTDAQHWRETLLDPSRKLLPNVAAPIEQPLAALERWRTQNPTGRPSKKGPDRAHSFFLQYVAARYRADMLEQSVVDRLAALGFELHKAPRKRLTGHQLFGEDSWNIHYEGLKAYTAANGWSGLWATVTVDGLALNSWVVWQRQLRRKGELSAERIAALDTLGIHWNRKTDWWIAWADSLQEFFQKHGHFRFPKTTEYRGLANRVMRIRTRLAGGTLPAAFIARLQAIQFPATREEESWQWAMQSLHRWREDHGKNSVIETELPPLLRFFLRRTRKKYREGNLSERHLLELRKLDIPWAELDSVHTQMIARLTRISRQMGKTNVEVMANRETDLRDWLAAQRAAAAAGTLSYEAAKELKRAGIDIDDSPHGDLSDESSQRIARSSSV